MRMWRATIGRVTTAAPTAPSYAIEDYVKAIYTLADVTGAPVTTSALAARLAVTPSSVSAMVKKLAAAGLVEHDPYREVRLTGPGSRLALRMVRRHRLLELFLVRHLGLSWDEVHDEAEVLEHALSPRLEAAIAASLGDPETDPHGDPIPTADGVLPAQPAVALVSLAPPARGTLVRVFDTDPAKLRHLTSVGVALGDRVEVLGQQPFGGGLSVRIGAAVHAIGPELAAAMQVRVDG